MTKFVKPTTAFAAAPPASHIGISDDEAQLPLFAE
jgi:hypothetical protein